MKSILKKLLHWIALLLSDSKFASTRRFIGILAFFNLMSLAIIGISVTYELPNTKLLMQLASYFFTISLTAIIGTTITNVTSTIKASQISSNEFTNNTDNSENVQ